MAHATRRATGFTLVEMMIVMGIILLVCFMALPSIVRLFDAGAEAQAINMLSAQTLSARAAAMQSGLYAGVYVRMCDNATLLADKPELANVCYTGVFLQQNARTPGDPLGPLWVVRPAPGYYSVRMPGTLVFGEVSATFLSGNNFANIAESAVATGLTTRNFTTFMLCFSPTGALVTRPNVAPLNIDFSVAPPFGAAGVWSNSFLSSEDGAMAVALFDYTRVRGRTAAEIGAYLNEFAQIEPVNWYTGQLFQRK